MKVTSNHFESWLESKGLSTRSVQSYLYYFKKFLYGDFNQKTVSDFLSNPSNNSSPSRAFISNFKEYLSTHYKQLDISQEELNEINLVKLPRLTGRKKKRLVKVLPLEYISLIEQHLSNEKEKLQLLLTFYCGLRLSEMLNVKLKDFNWDVWKSQVMDDNKKMISESLGELIIIGKGDKERQVPVPHFLMVRIARYCSRNKITRENRIFIKDNNKSFKLKSKERYWQSQLQKASSDAGITKRDSQGKLIGETRVHPHKLRHSYATYLLTKGFDIKEIQDLLGHSDIGSTQIYLHTDMNKIKEKMKDVF